MPDKANNPRVRPPAPKGWKGGPRERYAPKGAQLGPRERWQGKSNKADAATEEK